MTDSRSELAAATDLAGELLTFVVDTVEGVHDGVARRSFGSVGPAAKPVRAVHDGISRAVYGSVRGSLRAALGLGTAAAGVHPGWRDARPLTGSRAGGALLAAVSGIVGDGVAQRQPELDFGMGLWHDGAALPAEPEALASAFPEASGHLAVFVHGLCENEHVWHRRSRAHRTAARRGEPLPVRSIGEVVADRHDATPLYVRYNSGRRISDNGERLADLLDAVVAAWPVQVESLVLVGHSMGGLVIRSACAAASEAGQDWCEPVRHIAYLGTPHLGAPLEKVVHGGSWLLDQFGETRALAAFLRRRSVGVRDLRHGTIVAVDWREWDPDALRGVPPSDVPLLATAEHHVVSAVVTRSPQHPVGRLVGDLLVRSGSAAGRGRRRSVPFVSVLERPGMNHFDLTTDPEVVAYLAERLAP